MPKVQTGKKWRFNLRAVNMFQEAPEVMPAVRRAITKEKLIRCERTGELFSFKAERRECAS